MPIKTMTAALTLAMTVATSAGVDTCRAHDDVTMMQLSAVSEASEKLVAPVSVSHAPPPTTRNRAMAKLRKELPDCPSPHPERGYLIARIKKNDPTGNSCSKWTGAFTATSASATCKADDAVINDMIALAGHENVVFKVVMDDEATLPRHYKFTSASQQYSSENIPMDDVCVSEYSPTGPWTCGKSSITDNSPVFCGLTTAQYGPYCQNSDPQVQALHPGYTGTDDGYKGYGHAWRFTDRCNNKHGSASMYEAYMMLKCAASEDCYDGSTCVGGFCIAAAPTPPSTPAPTAPTPSPTPAPTAAPTASPTSSPTTPAPTAAATPTCEQSLPTGSPTKEWTFKTTSPPQNLDSNTKHTKVVMAVKSSLPAESEGVLFEVGGGVGGGFMGIVKRGSDYYFKVQVGGGHATDVSASSAAVIMRKLPDAKIPTDGNMHQIVWSIDPAAASLKVCIDGQELSAMAPGGQFMPAYGPDMWSGSDAGGFGVSTGGITGQTLATQLGWQGQVEGNLQVWENGQYTCACDQATPPPAGGAGAGASAVGDPHLQNIHGERFDLMKAGNHVLINIPRGMSAENALLRVQADARRLGGQCADMYFQQLNVTGSWAEAKQVGGYHYTVSERSIKAPEWVAFGKVELKVVHGRTDSGLLYLNLYVKHLGRAGFAVGGLLGEDDHEDVSAAPDSCAQRLALVDGSQSERSPSAVSVAVASFE
jgi:hypothetical protein